MSTTTSPTGPDVREALKNVRRLARVGQFDLAADLAFSSLRLEDVEPQGDATPGNGSAGGPARVHPPHYRPRRRIRRSAKLVLSAATLPDELARPGARAASRFDRPRRERKGLATLRPILAGSAGDGALPGALAAAASLAWADGRVAEAVELCHSAIRRADRTGNSVISTRSRLQLATMLTSLSEFVSEPAELLAIASDQAERHDVVSRGGSGLSAPGSSWRPATSIRQPSVLVKDWLSSIASRDVCTLRSDTRCLARWVPCARTWT